MARWFAAFEKTCTKCGRPISEREWNGLHLVGFQVIPAWQDEPGEVLELRNDTCGSTLARLAPFSPEQLEEGARIELAAMGIENQRSGALKRAQSIAADHLERDPLYYGG